MAAALTAGERREQFALDGLMDKGAVPRPGRGRPRLRLRRTAGDRGYSSPPARRRLKQRRIERLIDQLEQYRRIATHYQKRAANHHAMVALGMTMLWLI